jgi:hypothetical protein
MNRIGYLLLNIAAALYLFANGIMAISNDRGGELVRFVDTIFSRGDFSDRFLVLISISAIAIGIILLLPLFKIEIPILDTGLFFYAIGWVSFIVVNDIIYPVSNKVGFFASLKDLAIHLIVLGIFFTVIKRFNR